MICSLNQVQEKLRREGLCGWLLFLLQNRNPVAERFLDLPPGQMRTRRAFYWIPAQGTPIRLEHAIENRTLASRPGTQRLYLSHESLKQELGSLLQGSRRVAMEISLLGAIPALSLVDSGTVDLVRSLGVEVVSSANLAQSLTARLTVLQLQSHFKAAAALREIVRSAFSEMETRFRNGDRPRETEMRAFLERRMEGAGLVFDHPPIVACGPHAGDPHYEPGGQGEDEIRENQVVLIDLWGKLTVPGSIYADQTWMGFSGSRVPDKVAEVWSVVRNARRAVLEFVTSRVSAAQPVLGWEADEAARRVVREAGYGHRFIHRTGHSIDVDVHGGGANPDNLETHEERPLLHGTVMSVEPGIYLDEFGIRSENDLVIDLEGKVMVAEGTDQEDLILIRHA